MFVCVCVCVCVCARTCLCISLRKWENVVSITCMKISRKCNPKKTEAARGSEAVYSIVQPSLCRRGVRACVCLFVCLFIYLSFYLSVCLSV